MRNVVSAIAIVFLNLCCTHAHASDDGLLAADDEQLYEVVKEHISPASFASLAPVHKRMVTRIVGEKHAGAATRSFCFERPMPDDVMEVFNRGIFGDHKFEEIEFRWTETATDGPGLLQGNPITLTYSFIPDGTMISGDAMFGNADSPSNVNAFFTSIYGSETVWRAKFAQVFAAWQAITGITFVFEPNDDGGTFPDPDGPGGLPGVVGVRGDIRIGGHHIDGVNGVIAYNHFPDEGDMVIATDDAAFYGNLTGNSLRMRNAIAHELGHALGMPHTCPAVQTKLLEPFISTNYDGPQLDDRLSAQKQYGDPNAGNGSPATAVDFGALEDESVSQSRVSLFGNIEEDFYTFNIASHQDIDITVTPTGATYLSGPQSGSCTPGSPINTLTFMNLDVELIDSDAMTVLDTANATAAGIAETATLTAAPPGTYYARVYTVDAADDIQAYTLAIAVANLTGPLITNPQGGGNVELSQGTVTLGFDVTGNVNPTTYEWTKDGVPLVDGGEISIDESALTINPIALTHSGVYRLTVTDSTKRAGSFAPGSAPKLTATSSAIVLNVVTELPVARVATLAGSIAAIVLAGMLMIRRRVAGGNRYSLDS